jgi:hypothetical protein
MTLLFQFSSETVVEDDLSDATGQKPECVNVHQWLYCWPATGQSSGQLQLLAGGRSVSRPGCEKRHTLSYVSQLCPARVGNCQPVENLDVWKKLYEASRAVFLREVLPNIDFFWDVTPCKLVNGWRLFKSGSTGKRYDILLYCLTLKLKKRRSAWCPDGLPPQFFLILHSVLREWAATRLVSSSDFYRWRSSIVNIDRGIWIIMSPGRRWRQ